jgi:AraC-like DNA-binding protein
MARVRTSLFARERREYVHSPLLGGIELLAAEYRHHVFPRHVQEQAVIGVVQRGVIRFCGGGVDEEVREGDILFIAPGTPHEALGRGDGGWTYRALYLTPAQWCAAATALGTPLPTGAGIVRDPSLYERTRATHERLISGNFPEAAFEDHVRRLVASVAEHQQRYPGVATDKTVGDALARVRDLLDGTAGRRVTLSEMAAFSGLSRCYFLRAFSRAYGVSPYAYALNRRLQEAQRRLAAGEPISMTALEAGFADQAHLTRHFLRTVGVTPGEYQRAFA